MAGYFQAIAKDKAAASFLKYLILLFAISMSMRSSAAETILVGHTADGKEFYAKAYSLGKIIKGMEHVPGKNFLCVEMTDKDDIRKQELGLYDVMNHRLQWVAEMNFETDRYFVSSQGIIIESGGKAQMLDDTGNIVWEKKFYPMYIDEESGTVLGYKTETSKDLIGADLNTGEARWESGLKHKLGWTARKSLPGGGIAIAAEDFCLLDPVTGSMKTMKIHTSAERVDRELRDANEKKIGIASFFFGAVGGAIASGVLAKQQGANFWTGKGGVQSMVSHLNSNICTDGDRFFFADRHHLWCMDKTLTPLWDCVLERASSMSSLYISGDTLYHENYGVGLDYEGNEYKDTKPFLFAYNKTTGTPISLEDGHGGLRSLCFVRTEGDARFEAKQLTYNEMEHYPSDSIFPVDSNLTPSLYCIHNSSDYWIVDEQGKPCLHIEQGTMQMNQFGNVLVVLNGLNQLIQFSLDEIGQ